MKTIENGMEFINDENVIGKWEHFSVIKAKEEFDPKKQTPITEHAFHEIYFLENGEKYWIFEGWTKGYLLIHYGGDDPILCYKYSIQKKDEEQFLLIENPDEQPYICVLKKVSSKHFQINEIGRRDNIDVPFVQDESIVGDWKSIAFVDKIDCFNPDDLCDELWLRQITFHSDGTLVRVYSDECWEDKWTKGFVLDYKKSIASAYTIKIWKDKEFLFVEWKMGNYVYGGAEPTYYVFTRK